MAKLLLEVIMITNDAMGTMIPFAGEDACFRRYADNVNSIFSHAPKAAGTSKDYAILPFKYGLQDYLYRLYPLFRKFIVTGALPNLFYPPNCIDTDDYYKKGRKFVAAVKIRKLRQGGCIDRYVKDLSVCSPYITRLIKFQKGRYLLANSDVESLDYKLALFACFTCLRR